MSTPPGRVKAERPDTEAEEKREILDSLVRCDRPDIDRISSYCLVSLAGPRLSGGGISIWSLMTFDRAIELSVLMPMLSLKASMGGP